MKNTGGILFIIFLISFSIHQLGQKFLGFKLSAFDRYLDPVLGMPLLLYAFLLERRYLCNHGVEYTLSKTEILVTTLFVSLVSEFLFPYWSDNFTYDPFDFLAFGIGSILFYFTMNNPNSTRKKHT